MSASEGIKVKLFLLTRSLENNPGINVKEIIKHWALLIEYYWKNDESGEVEVDGKEIIEGKKEGNYFIASLRSFLRSTEQEWSGYNGYKKICLHDPNNHVLLPSRKTPENFQNKFNKEKKEYHALANNCQTFLEQFLLYSYLQNLVQLPQTASGAFKKLKKVIQLYTAPSLYFLIRKRFHFKK